MRTIFHVRCHGEPSEDTENRIMAAIANAVDIPEKNWGILTIGRSYYHDTANCLGHADPAEPCITV